MFNNIGVCAKFCSLIILSAVNKLLFYSIKKLARCGGIKAVSCYRLAGASLAAVCGENAQL